MSILELFILAVGLSMDACAIAICKGLAMKNAGLRQMCIVGAWFGLAQAAMPLIGYLLGTGFADYITSFDHWIAFVLLGIIGGVMIKESFDKEENKNDASLAVRIMLPMALATSIDALAVGVTFAFLKVRIIPAVAFIGVVTFAFGAAGVKIGTVFGAKYKAKAEFAGGVILILLGVKILLEHLGVINF